MSDQLNINLLADRFALEHGFGHWSCLSSDSNNELVRTDGKKCYVIRDYGILLSLRNADIDSIIENEHIEKIKEV